MRGEHGPVKALSSGGMIRLGPVSLALLLLLTACGGGGAPRREVIDGVEHVRNRARPVDGITLPAPQPADSLLMLAGGSEGRPRWSAIRDVRITPAGGLAVLDMHRIDVTWFNASGNLLATMDLALPGLGLTSPIAIAFNREGDGACVDMALRRALSFKADGTQLAAFPISEGLPMDLDLGFRGDLYVLTSSHPDEGREHLLQVRRYGIGGAPLSIAGNDSLLLEQMRTSEQESPPPMSISVNPHNTFYAAGRDYTIHQVLADGHQRLITRPTIESRIPDAVLEQRRSLMSRRISSQQQDVPIMETVAIVQVIGLDRGGVLVQTNEWHPSMLDDEICASCTILLFDEFSAEGVFQHRYAVEIPVPLLEVVITDEADGHLCGFGVPSHGEGPMQVLRFRLPAPS